MTRDLHPKPKSPSVLTRSGRPILLVLFFGVMSLVATLSDTGHELNPPHSLTSWSEAIGIGLGAICLVHGLRQRPRGLKLATATVIFSILTAAICSMMVLGTLSRIREAVVFHGDGLSAYETDLHVSDASIHHGRGGPSYYIELRDYSGLFEIPQRDYISAFGSVEGLRPEGYCVKVTIQRTGSC